MGTWQLGQKVTATHTTLGAALSLGQVDMPYKVCLGKSFVLRLALMQVDGE